jgi:hypothetical protein
MENQKEKGIFVRVYEWFKNLTVRGLLGAILMAFVIIIILMSVTFIPGIMSKISSSLSAALYSVFVPAESATMTIDRTIIKSGEDFNINFKKGDDAVDGLFTVSYSCDTAAELLSVETNGLKKIDCDTKYYLLDKETSIKIRANTQDSVVRLVIEGAFENNEDQKVETIGVSRVTVKNDSLNTVVTPVETPAKSPTVVKPTTPIVQPVYYGKPDLAVRMLQVGLLTGNNIINKNSFSYNETVGIKFEIRNDGDAVTGPWTFTANLPSISTPTYNSSSQISLRPGESIIFTLGFSNLTNMTSGIITVNADPLNLVTESSEYNNTVTQSISNTSYNSNYYNNNYNNNYNYNYNNTGCYDANGWFTYNCPNNNYNNDWNYNYYNDLRVSCYADPEDPETGDRVRWYAEADGGDGDYDYDWTGTNSLDSSSENPSKTYTSRGWKYATVTVTDGDDNESSATCSVYVD